MKFYDPYNKHILSVALFVWLGDHEENNRIAQLYPYSCRICCVNDGINIYRSKTDTDQWVSNMVNRFFQKKQKGICYKEAQDRGQHISLVKV